MIKDLLANIVNKKDEDSQILYTGTVSSTNPLEVKFYPGDDAISVIATSGALGLNVGSNVLMVKYLSKFIVVGVLGNLNQGCCILKRNTAQTIPTATFTAIQFGSGTTQLDPLDMHDETTNNTRITIPADGIYNINISGRFDASTDGNARIIYIYVNGGQQNAVAGEFDSSGRWGGNASLNLELNEDDYVEFYVYQATGGDLDIGGTGYEQLHFSVIPMLGGAITPSGGSGGSEAPTGSITQFAGSSAPTGWLLCDGSAVSRSTYSTLFSLIGEDYGVGDGSTTFNLPDMKGKVPVGYNSSDADFDALGETGGAKTHTLTSDEMPSHTHTQNSHTHTQNSHTHTQNSHDHTQDSHDHTVRWKLFDGLTAGSTWILLRRTDASDSYDGTDSDAANSTTANNQSTTATNQSTTATNQSTTATNQNTGGGSAHNNLQPYITLNYIIKT